MTEVRCRGGDFISDWCMSVSNPASLKGKIRGSSLCLEGMDGRGSCSLAMCSEEDTSITVQADFEGTHLEIRIPEQGSSMSSLTGAAKAKADSEFVLAMFDQFRQSEDTKDARIAQQAARIAELEGKVGPSNLTHCGT